MLLRFLDRTGGGQTVDMLIRKPAVRWAVRATFMLVPLLIAPRVAECLPNGQQNGKPSDVVALPPLVADEDISPVQPIRSGFMVNVSVKDEPEPSGNYVVNGAGNILIHAADVLSPVMVKGLNCTQAAAAVETFLRGYIKSPAVVITIVSVPRSVLSVTGAVHHAGFVTASHSARLADALASAETTDLADLTHVSIVRRTGAGTNRDQSVTTYSFENFINPAANSRPDITQNPEVADGDVVVVPAKPHQMTSAYSIAGQVVKPEAAAPLKTTQVITLREAIAFAGGATPEADRKRVVIVHAGKPRILDLDLAESGDPDNNLPIENNDSIYVERVASRLFVSVEGAFAKPGTRLPFYEGMTLTTAILQAGGPTAVAKLSEGYVYRQQETTKNGSRLVPFKWKDIVKGKSADLALRPGDIIWMEASNPGLSGNAFYNLLYPISMVLSAAKL